MPQGLVLRSTGSRYLVRGEDGSLHECVAQGKLRIKGWKSTNPLSVGDVVTFEEQRSNELPGSIVDLHDRRNYLVRRSVNLSHHKHVIAANLDQALLMVTVARPRTSFGFIDRFLVTAEAYQVPVIIVFNKVDDLRVEEELDRLAEYQEVYEGAGYRTVITSAMNGTGVPELKVLLKGKVTLLSGHSGVGKSTLVNAIDPELDLHTLEISEASGKGQHTTTNAEMYEVNTDGWTTPQPGHFEQSEATTPQPGHCEQSEATTSQLSTSQLLNSSTDLHRQAGSLPDIAPAPQPPTFIIDTPGVKGFGLVDLRPEDIGDQYPEMFRLKQHCRFNNCMHKDEPGCAVRKAVEAGEVAASRYNSYLDMLAGIDEESPYRLD
ncbi:MAG: ribosome small subunit-dependent GTPase A [Flavobacteriales bacterium]|nr:ribosome small subunit-dependent GTPase A [Flavobacteriales bacterium]